MGVVDLPLEYPDLVFDLDLDPFANETTSTLQNLIQDVTHVLRQKLGSNPDDEGRGIGIDDYLNGTEDDLRKLPGLIDAQLGQDDRITSVHTTIIREGDGPFQIRIEIGVDGAVIPLQYGWQDGNFTNLTG